MQLFLTKLNWVTHTIPFCSTSEVIGIIQSFMLVNKANHLHNITNPPTQLFLLAIPFHAHTTTTTTTSSSPIHEEMRERMERFVVLPFSVGCVSQSSIDVIEDRPKKPQAESNPSTKEGEREGEVLTTNTSSTNGGKVKNPLMGFLPLPRSNISAGFQRLIKGFKGSLSHLFSYKLEEEDEDDDDDGGFMDMEIGLPTDIQHVGHIGWDGSTTTLTTMKGWDAKAAPPPPGPLLSLPSISLKQFELAMAAQAGDDHAPHDHKIVA